MKVFVIVFVTLQWCVVLHDAQKSKVSTTISYRDFMVGMEKKFIQYKYNPNYGYEPYWADGEGVLMTPKPDPNVITTKVPLVCGEECNYLYRRIKHVCAHKSNNVKVNGCWSTLGGLFCQGKPGDDLNPGFKTFNTYCDFLEGQCRDKFWDPGRYVLVHVGKCKNVDDSFKPIWDSWNPVSRMQAYLSTYMYGHGLASTRRTGKPRGK